jgi:glycosyltransferase involved in cell wall biosynthesis
VRLGVVIPCYRQEHFLPRTLAAVEQAFAGSDWRGVLVLSDPEAGPPLPALGPHWSVLRAGPELRAPGTRALTPGAARNAGFAACGGEWVLFVDADVEVERDWLLRAIAEVVNDPEVAGAWGRIEEWFVDGAGIRSGSRDLYRVGDGDHDAAYTATFSFYRRAALERVGGYEPRLQSEEDFELGLRLRRAGYRLRTLTPFAARHWSAPRPSFGEIGRRWRTGLCFGPGQVLRLYLGHRDFPTLARRNAHYLVMLALWVAGPLAFAAGGGRGLAAWAILPAALLAFMTLRKRSLRLATHSLLTWTVMAAGTLVGFVRGGAPAPVPVREVAC